MKAGVFYESIFGIIVVYYHVRIDERIFLMFGMFPALLDLQRTFFIPRGLSVRNYTSDAESAEYSACRFDLNAAHVYFRCAKITPTKIGQFVTFWKRDSEGITTPYDFDDSFDTLIVYVKTEKYRGVFIFPKSVLFEYGVISKDGKGGKRAIRVYPVWDKAENVQAKKTQAWQLKYFTEII